MSRSRAVELFDYLLSSTEADNPPGWKNFKSEGACPAEIMSTQRAGDCAGFALRFGRYMMPIITETGGGGIFSYIHNVDHGASQLELP